LALAAGSRLGAYEVVSLLGEGGMGQVYRAKDTRLKRDVALKILPDAFASDPDRVARFQREAELLATLNHANIAAIYGLEQADGMRALVLELVEGPTLADRIAQGPIPIDEAVLIASQIADALEAAHEKGVIHRDLKPANIKLTPDDKVKVLDFGLAKMLETPVVSGALSMSPTLSVLATYAGVILGTAAYMSPEQARGKTVDKRTDVWAFGCVLYEMLTGTPPFQGEDVAEVIGAIIHKDIAWDRLPPNTPPAVRMVLARCLERDPKDRLRDIGDVRLALRGAFESPRPVIEAPVAVRSHRGPLIALATLLVLATAGLGWIALRSPAKVPASVSRFGIVPPASQPLVIRGSDADLAISPDGTHIVYIAGTGEPQIFVRALDQLEAMPLRGLGPVRGPFMSPDSHWVGFMTGAQGGDLKKVSITGGPAITLCRVNGAARGASWGAGDMIVFATADPTTGLMSVPGSGGEPKVLTTRDPQQGEQDHLWPSFLPGGRAVLFTITSASGIENSQIAVLDLETGRKKVLIRGGSFAQYVGSGHLVYAVQGTLRAVRFDLTRLDVLGDPVPVLEQVTTTNVGAADFSVSGQGTLVYVPGGGQNGAARSLVWLNRQGREERIKSPPRTYQFVRLSPDGTRAALEIRDQDNDVWVWDFGHETLTRLTFNSGFDGNPVWTPDGRRIVFNSVRGGAQNNLYWQAADGTGTAERLTTSPNAQIAESFSPDGTRLIFRETLPKTAQDIHMLLITQAPGEKERQNRPLIETPFLEENADVSPDGHWLAYQSSESGSLQVYVRPFPNVDSGRWQVSTNGGSRPIWARNGHELFYIEGRDRLMTVPVRTAPSFSAGNPTKLFEGRYFSATGGRTYDVSADGQRFLMITADAATNEPASTSTPASMVVVERWFEDLKQRVPAK
jgi:serine/threonine-protein kinase